MANEPDKADDELDLAEELQYIAAHQKMFTKSEMAMVMKEAAAELRDLWEMMGMQEAANMANSDAEAIRPINPL